MINSSLKILSGLSGFTRLGAELIGDKGYNGIGWWLLNGVEASIFGGVLVLNNVLDRCGSYKLNILTIGKKYKVIYTILNYSSGQMSLFDGTEKGMIRNSNGTYSEIYTAKDVNIAIYSVGNGATMEIDNISVREVI